MRRFGEEGSKIEDRRFAAGAGSRRCGVSASLPQPEWPITTKRLSFIFKVYFTEDNAGIGDVAHSPE